MENNDQTVTFDGVEYKYSELTDPGKMTVNQLNIIERDILETRLLLDRHIAAKTTFIAQFEGIVADIDKKET